MFTNLYPFSPLNSRDSRLCWWASFGVDLSQNLYWQRNRHKKLSMNACREIREVNCCSLLTSFLYISLPLSHSLSRDLSLSLYLSLSVSFPSLPGKDLQFIYQKAPARTAKQNTWFSLSLSYTHTYPPRSCSSYTMQKEARREVLSLSPLTHSHILGTPPWWAARTAKQNMFCRWFLSTGIGAEFFLLQVAPQWLWNWCLCSL